jgi:hypothetical protein
MAKQEQNQIDAPRTEAGQKGAAYKLDTDLHVCFAIGM